MKKTADESLDPEILLGFLAEANGHLRAVRTGLAAVRANPAERGPWQEIGRAAHTLKGTAAMVGFADVTTLAHRMEDLLDGYSDGTRVVTSGEIELLLDRADAIENAIHGRPADFAPLFAKLAVDGPARRSTDFEDHFLRLHRTVRHAAGRTGKRAELIVDGERTGLDKAVLEAMADPLLHLLRNAVDHGLESAEVRRALGKPEVGTVRLSADHEGGQIVLRIADDGRGIDVAAVRGLTPDGDALTVEDVYSLLFAPGFSTKSAISELSGRGVGLDVVKARVEVLQGTVAITSTPGRGTTFTIRLPREHFEA